jgi:PAS domain S-box-containing protein
MLIVWGPEQITLYNDGYAAMCGSRHPAALGRPFRDLWFDIWDAVNPIITAAYDGISTSMDDIEFIMHRNGYPEETHFAFTYSPVRNDSGVVLGMFCACVETTDQVMTERRLAKERKQMRQIFESALGAVAILDGPDHVFTFANTDYQKLVGHRGIVGKSVAEALPEVIEQGFVKLLDGVLATGEAYVGRGVEIELQQTPGAATRRHFLDFAYHPIGGSDGRAEGIFAQIIDVTDRITAERRQELLNQELAHRLKNQLSLVQAVANVTLRSAVDLSAARKSLNQRIAVLGRAQEKVIAGTTDATTVVEIVEDVISLHDVPAAKRFKIGGPECYAGPRTALSLTLMLHELATNAAKYGALSVESGTVHIVWRNERTPEGDHFVLEWEERGGPAVSTPTTTALDPSC